MDLLRMAIVYPHLIACCVAIGLVVTNDLAMVRQLLTGEGPAHHDEYHLTKLHGTIVLALGVLWLTGVAIVWLDVSANGWAYLLNPKLQAKVAIVLLLTFNGIVLHRGVMPALKRAGSLLKLPPGRLQLAVFSGVFSGVSWFYAAMLGIGRPLNWKYSFGQIMIAYPFLIMGGFSAMLALVAFSAYRTRKEQWGWISARARDSFLDPLGATQTQGG
jgi:hypothetical protein